MYLSRLILNPTNRAVRRDLGDCQEMHRTVMSAFPAIGSGDARSRLGVLYRVELSPHTVLPLLYLQSAVPPDCSAFVPGYISSADGTVAKSVADSYAAIREGAVLVFRLLANPTRKVDTKTGPDEKRRNGRRVDLREEAAQMDWLRRKGAVGGFELLEVSCSPGVADVRSIPQARIVGDSVKGGLIFGAVLFEGRLRVVDANQFRKTLAEGIGSGKAYGFGLLSVAPGR